MAKACSSQPGLSCIKRDAPGGASPIFFIQKIRQKASAYSSARSTKFSTNRKVHTQRIGWISFVCFLQIFTMQ